MLNWPEFHYSKCCCTLASISPCQLQKKKVLSVKSRLLPMFFKCQRYMHVHFILALPIEHMTNVGFYFICCFLGLTFPFFWFHLMAQMLKYSHFFLFLKTGNKIEFLIQIISLSFQLQFGWCEKFELTKMPLLWQ